MSAMHDSAASEYARYHEELGIHTRRASAAAVHRQQEMNRHVLRLCACFVVLAVGVGLWEHITSLLFWANLGFLVTVLVIGRAKLLAPIEGGATVSRYRNTVRLSRRPGQ
jgi:hypothetical protein